MHLDNLVDADVPPSREGEESFMHRNEDEDDDDKDDQGDENHGSSPAVSWLHSDVDSR